MKFAINILFVIGLVGCSTGYHPLNLNGGYTSMQYQPNSFSVEFEGNDSTSKKKTFDMAMLHASNLTIKNGFSYFEVVKSNTYEGEGENSVFAESFIYGLNGQSIAVNVPITKLLIRCSNDEVLDFKTFNAQLVKTKLVEAYGL